MMMMKNYYQRYHLLKKGELLHGDDDDDDDESSTNSLGIFCGNKRGNGNPKLFYFLLISLLSCFCLILVPQLLTFASSCPLLYTIEVEDEKVSHEVDANTSICSSVPYGTICCDRSSNRSDTCIMKGDVRMDSSTSSIFLYRENPINDYILSGLLSDEENVNNGKIVEHETIRPYTRKWETSVMNSIGELNLYLKKNNQNSDHQCDVQHDVPALFFSTGGYTGNAYHDINDGILPLYITSHHFNKQVVFVILDYHNWWFTKYSDVISQLSDYPIIDFSSEKKIHCFPESIVGLKIHDELTIDPNLMEGGKTIVDFRNVLDKAYWPRIKGLIQHEKDDGIEEKKKKPKLVIISRKGSREITNEDLLEKMAGEIGFSVKIFRPDRTTELAKLYKDLNSSDVMIGVHGAAMTYFLFMKPSSVFIQIIPIGLDWASETYYGEPAVKLGLKYVGYKILPKESSLYDVYSKDDIVLTDPESVNRKGWEFTKEIYLENQKVNLNLPRFRKRLVRAYDYILKKKKENLNLQL